jgi:5-methylcytosine-specific restriction endonuclease McrA
MPKRICLTCGVAFHPTKVRQTRCASHYSRETRFNGAWRKQRNAILSRDGHQCRYCGRPANTVDHIIPVKRGGSDEPTNLVAACASCNASKGAKTVEEWRSGRSRF